jgi:hypothetical protein
MLNFVGKSRKLKYTNDKKIAIIDDSLVILNPLINGLE